MLYDLKINTLTKTSPYLYDYRPHCIKYNNYESKYC